mgnify:CR=1 FL=1
MCVRIQRCTAAGADEAAARPTAGTTSPSTRSRSPARRPLSGAMPGKAREHPALPAAMRRI